MVDKIYTNELEGSNLDKFILIECNRTDPNRKSLDDLAKEQGFEETDLINDILADKPIKKLVTFPKKNVSVPKPVNTSLSHNSIVEQDYLKNISKQYSVPIVDLSQVEFKKDALSLVPSEMCCRHKYVPISKNSNGGAEIVVAFSDPSNLAAMDDIKFYSGYNVKVLVASEQQIVEALKKYYPNASDFLY
ncbi:hypothetical protein HOK51_01850 [Candidatus Woesearchaeota archaeon]|jgi:type IV pilus assembly protein PilB|nr:hypothetical protein [Candidatus Woesearchaeota archaeon]MBT6518559.1 hypothetical protein [Candidatus Woesearchaeota archaeon]MBT7366901.1 hypothetical protein [Candidatus Woesearchaeota archaeon]